MRLTRRLVRIAEAVARRLGQAEGSRPKWEIPAKYSPTLIGECQKALKWAKQIVSEWLVTSMLRHHDNRDEVASAIVRELADHALMLSHGRHLSAEKCKQIGLVIDDLAEGSPFQDAVLSVHHAMIHTLGATGAYKIIENQNGVAYIQTQQTIIVRQ